MDNVRLRASVMHSCARLRGGLAVSELPIARPICRPSASVSLYSRTHSLLICKRELIPCTVVGLR